MKNAASLLSLLCVAGLPVVANAQVLTLTGPAAQTFANGGGNGFGGTLGAGSFTMSVSGGSLNITFNAGNSLNDTVGLLLDTQTGGFGDGSMNDQADPGRRAVSNVAGNTTPVVTPSGFLADFGVSFSGAGVSVYSLNAGNTNGHLGFISFNGSTNTVSIPLATLGNPTNVDFFAGYSSGTGFGSNESLPASAPLNSIGNPGFGGALAVYDFNRYVIPTPGTAALLGLGLAASSRRRR